ncbi:hypothetical protein LTR17_027558 [Elasticomyces elasticus]|nr:hypothetical protein LTR17_027558 [Elasticomyces elasticus]
MSNGIELPQLGASRTFQRKKQPGTRHLESQLQRPRTDRGDRRCVDWVRCCWTGCELRKTIEGRGSYAVTASHDAWKLRLKANRLDILRRSDDNVRGGNVNEVAENDGIKYNVDRLVHRAVTTAFPGYASSMQSIEAYAEL